MLNNIPQSLQDHPTSNATLFHQVSTNVLKISFSLHNWNIIHKRSHEELEAQITDAINDFSTRVVAICKRTTCYCPPNVGPL